MLIIKYAAEKSYPHETRIIYIVSQNAPIILEKSGIVKLKKKILYSMFIF